ncbi:MAG: twitching motility protein PilT [Lachnospiraceae bacterium]|nr:twitching motility protein PilT [Lachnospiraceae bacterium]
MVQLIVGKKGKGKTKCLLDKVNEEVKNILGNVVFLDKNTKHMYELNNKIRLIDVHEFGIESTEAFIGFVAGIISQDHDLQQIYMDSFLDISCLGDGDISATVAKLEKLSEKYSIDMILSISTDKQDIPENLKSSVIISL